MNTRAWPDQFRVQLWSGFYEPPGPTTDVTVRRSRYGHGSGPTGRWRCRRPAPVDVTAQGGCPDRIGSLFDGACPTAATLDTGSTERLPTDSMGTLTQVFRQAPRRVRDAHLDRRDRTGRAERSSWHRRRECRRVPQFGRVERRGRGLVSLSRFGDGIDQSVVAALAGSGMRYAGRPSAISSPGSLQTTIPPGRGSTHAHVCGHWADRGCPAHTGTKA